MASTYTGGLTATTPIKQANVVLNQIMAEAKGAQPIEIADASTFLAVYGNLPQPDKDMLVGALTNMLHRTIFRTRAYVAKFDFLIEDVQTWGLYDREISIVDPEMREYNAYEETDLPAGERKADMFRAPNPVLLERGITGGGAYRLPIKVLLNQLNTALTGPEEFNAFVNMQMTNARSVLQQAVESMARATVRNFVGGKLSMTPGQDWIDLLSGYNTDNNKTYADFAAIRASDDYADFVAYAMAQIDIVSKRMTERTYMYQQQTNGKSIADNVPKDRQRLFVFSDIWTDMAMRVLPNIYHSTDLSLPRHEAITYWQGMEDPGRLLVNPRAPGPDGVVTTLPTIDTRNVFAVLYDQAAMGVTVLHERVDTTPFEADGEYWVNHFKGIRRYRNDFARKGVVFTVGPVGGSTT